ncbi:MAG: hypothetical protein L0219_14040 [Phycisphaerales bacterium]|nr:hypothetical protein [Phycisphaerales bacterium]
MPDHDPGVLSYIVNLASQVEQHGHEAFGLTVDDLALIIARRDAYSTAYSIAGNPATKTRPKVLAKNQARDEADRVSRMYAQIIKANPDVPKELKVSAGVHIDKETRTPKGQPRTFPFVNFIINTPHVTKLRFRDVGLPTGRIPREDGITHLLLYAEIAPKGELTRSEAALRLIAAPTRNPVHVRFDQVDLPAGKGLTALYRGRWLSSKGLMGPLGPPVSVTVPMSGSSAKQAKGDQDEDQPPLKLAA